MKGTAAGAQVAGAVSAGADLGRRSTDQAGVVEALDKEQPSSVRVHHPVVGYSVHKEHTLGLFSVYNMGGVLQRR